jgi:LemA protein
METVKGYAAHEKGALEAVIAARAKAMGAKSVAEHAQAENMLSGALKNLFALAEAYPDLKAVSAFTELQRELADTENKIQAARRFYNSNVQHFNTKQETFPTVLVAKPFGFRHADFFELTEAAAKEPVRVQF